MTASVKKHGRRLLCRSVVTSAPVRASPSGPWFGLSLYLVYPSFSCFFASSPVPWSQRAGCGGRSVPCPALGPQVRTGAVCVRSAAERRLGVVYAGVGGFEVAEGPGMEPIQGKVWVGGDQWWNPYVLRKGHPLCAWLPKRALVHIALKQKKTPLSFMFRYSVLAPISSAPATLCKDLSMGGVA